MIRAEYGGGGGVDEGSAGVFIINIFFFNAFKS